MATIKLPKTKIYDGVPYRFYNSYTTKSAADIEAKRFRKDGLESRVQKRKYHGGENSFVFYVVWYYGGPTRASIKKHGGK